MFCYLRIAGTTQVNSDGAGLVLQASDVLHGNVLLHGWWATDVSFYTTELPEYLVVTAAAGLRPEVVHICSALTYTILVLLAAFVARGRARGAEGLVRALLAAGLILAPQPTGPPPWCCSAARTTWAPGFPCWSSCCCSTGPGPPGTAALVRPGRRAGCCSPGRSSATPSSRWSASCPSSSRACSGPAGSLVPAGGGAGTSGRRNGAGRAGGRRRAVAGPPPGTSGRSRLPPPRPSPSRRRATG